MNTDTVPAGRFNASDVEARKDELNLRPALEFVERHLQVYERAWRRLMHRTPTITKSSRPSIMNLDCVIKPQIMNLDALHILERMPTVLLELSLLEAVDYQFASTVPVPIFEPDGSWKNADMVKNIDFPREVDHPSRILIGYSTGNTIYPSLLPECVFEGYRSRWFYQLHVFVHEFFHTVEYLRRSVEARGNVVLERDGEEYTLQEWWKKWEDEYNPNPPSIFPSRYASNYRRDLELLPNSTTNIDAIQRAIAEQICESFVGFTLGIVPNDEDNPDFQEHSPRPWELIRELVTSQVVKK